MADSKQQTEMFEEWQKRGLSGLFGGAPVISTYTRRQAIEDGVLVDLMQQPTAEFPELDDLRAMALEAGFRHPLAMTATAFGKAVAPIDGELPEGQDLKGRLWDVLMVMRTAVRAAPTSSDRLHFNVKVWNGQRDEDVGLWSLCGPGDDGQPVITIMLEWED